MTAARLCRCGHEKTDHPNGGPCRKCAAPVPGGAPRLPGSEPCPKFHTRKRPSVSHTVDDPPPRAVDVFEEISKELTRQRALLAQGKFPWSCDDPSISDALKLAVLGEEFGEAAREVNEAKDRAKLRAELVQVAAVCVAWVRSMSPRLNPAAAPMLGRHVDTPPAPKRATVRDGIDRSILRVLAQVGPSSRDEIAIFSGYSAKSGSFAAALAHARADGLIEGSAAQISITDAGRKALGAYEPLPVGDALAEWWIGQLETAPARLLSILRDVSPGWLGRDQLADMCGYSPKSGSFAHALAALRKRKLVEPGLSHGRIRLAKELQK